MFVKTVVLHAEMQPNLRWRMFLTILMVWCRSKSDDFVAFGIFCAFVNGFLQCYNMSKTIHSTMAQCKNMCLDQKEHLWVWRLRSFKLEILLSLNVRISVLIFPVCFRRKHSTIFHLSGPQRLHLFLDKMQTHLSKLIHWVVLNQIIASPKYPALHLKMHRNCLLWSFRAFYYIWTLIVESLFYNENIFQNICGGTVMYRMKSNK